jgi:SAM-dependent methyltransferase/NAD(P)-dependent dehydrogenase (short-subunit alcohol dehydrogenase family)/acyl carrier protein
MLLGAVGTLWTRGVGIDWRGGEAAGSGRSVAGLPTYPFQRERHWLEAAPRHHALAPSSPGAHPLLGPRVRSAAPTPHFEARLSAASPGFLADHRVHDVVIAPSPALIEMAAAAAAQVLGDERPVLTEFAIEQPLVLPAEAALVVQTVVTPGEAGAVAIEIASLEDEATSHWRVHARATARRRPTADAPTATVDLGSLKGRCPGAVAGPEYYTMLAGRGLDFGPCFRGIARLWRGEREALAEIVVPDGLRAESDRYRVHPAILDACLQTLGGAWPAGDDETYLLVGADRLSLPAPGGAAVPRFSHAILRDGDPRSGVVMGDVRVLDAEGRTIAELEGVHLRRARPESLALVRTSTPSDWIYQVAWQPAAPRPSETSHGLGGSRAVSAALEPQVGAIAAGEGFSLYDELLPALDVLSYQYVLRAFADLGWAPVVGERIDAPALAATLGIQNKHGRLLACLLGILTEEGVLRRVGRDWMVLTPLPPADVVAAERRIAEQFPAGTAEITVTLDCGRALASALRGEMDPLQLLFAPAPLANTERLYTGTPAARTFNTLVARAVMAAIGASPRARRVRILEIGAGTGGTTNAILATLPEGVAEYVFTDVSPTFTTRAAERLGAPHRRFRPLDIERDPAEQGMGAERFDIVLAANVLHATRDLRRTLAHVRRLLAPDGLLILLEGTVRHRWVDLTFGLTEGWWRFSDFDLRPDHALLSAEQWLDLLTASGFAAAQRLPSAPSGRALSSQTVLIAQAAAREVDARSWLVLADRGGVGSAVGHALESRGAGPVTIGPVDMDDARLRQTIQSGGPWRGVVDLRSLDAPAVPRSAVLAPRFDAAAAVTRICDGVRVLVQLLGRGGSEASPSLWVVTQGAQPVGKANAHVAVTQAPVWGLGRVAALEHPEIWGGLMDLDPDDTVAATAERIADQLTNAGDEDQIAFRAGERYVPRLIRAKAPDSTVSVRGDGVYLITGGLGGLGLKVAQWLVARGARHLVLVGRRGLPPRDAWSSSPPGSDADRQTSTITALEATGTRVTVVVADVGDREAMSSLFARFGRELPLLRGIVHAAAHLSAETLIEMRPEDLAAVLAPKVAGAWLLHELSRDLALDFYVFFSSTTTLLGSSRLGHYAAGNQFLDSLAHLRRAEGRPALSVNWGTWDEMRAASEADRRLFVQAGLLPMRAGDALGMLGRLLGGAVPQVTVAAVDWAALTALYEARRRRPFLEGLTTGSATEVRGVRRRPAELLARLAASSAEERSELLAAHIREEVGHVLRLDVTQIDVKRGLFDMGMDSLMALDLKTRLETLADQRLPSTVMFNYPTVTALAGYLEDRLFGSRPPVAAAAPVTAEVNRVAGSRDGLSEDEIAALLAEKLERMR